MAAPDGGTLAIQRLRCKCTKVLAGTRSSSQVGSIPLIRHLQPGHCEAVLLIGIVAGTFGSERSSVDTGGRRGRT
jgi:hypothetical protein